MKDQPPTPRFPTDINGFVHVKPPIAGLPTEIESSVWDAYSPTAAATASGLIGYMRPVAADDASQGLEPARELEAHVLFIDEVDTPEHARGKGYGSAATFHLIQAASEFGVHAGRMHIVSESMVRLILNLQSLGLIQGAFFTNLSANRDSIFAPSADFPSLPYQISGEEAQATLAAGEAAYKASGKVDDSSLAVIECVILF